MTTREEYLKLVDFHYWGGDSGDETKPSESVPVVEEIYQRPESEEEKRERMWKAIQEFSST